MGKPEVHIIHLVNDENRESFRKRLALFKFRMQVGEERRTEGEILTELISLSDVELWQAHVLMVAHGMASLRYAT